MCRALPLVGIPEEKRREIKGIGRDASGSLLLHDLLYSHFSQSPIYIAFALLLAAATTKDF